MPSRRSLRQLEEMIESPSEALGDPEYWREPVCRRWLYHVAVRALFNPAEAVPLAVVGVRLALRTVRRQQRRGIQNRCILVRAYGVLGSTYRAADKLDKADRALTKAEEHRRRCHDPDVRSDVLLRRAVLQAYLAQRPDGTLDLAGLRKAAVLAGTAVDDARATLAQARARNTRGMILLYSGDALNAAQDARWSLAAIDPEARPYDHISALSLLINALSASNKADREEAAQYLEQLRASLPPRCPAVRARFLWAEALLTYHNGRRKARTRNFLNQARKRFIRLKMRAEAAAVTAELSRHDPTGAVPRLCADLLPILESGPVRDLVEQLRRARVVERVEFAERLRAMIHGPGVLPAAA